MKTKNPMLISVSIFLGLALIFAILAFAANSLNGTFSQFLLASLGSAIFGAGLTFFLLRVIGLK